MSTQARVLGPKQDWSKKKFWPETWPATQRAPKNSPQAFFFALNKYYPEYGDLLII